MQLIHGVLRRAAEGSPLARRDVWIERTPRKRRVNTGVYAPGWMARTILVVEDEPTLRETLVDALEADGSPCRCRGRRARGADAVPRGTSRPGAPRSHAPGAVRHRGHAHHPRGIRGPHRHADGQGFGARQGRRPGARGRRLCDQALLAARADGTIRALFRRSEANVAVGAPPTIVDLGRVQADLGGHRLLRDGATLPIKPKAFELLAFLLRNPGQVFTRDQLLEKARATTTPAKPARSMSTSTGCAARSRRTPATPRSSTRCAVSAMSSGRPT